jgi:hypothetical protein
VTLRAAEASVVGLHPLFGLPSSAFAVAPLASQRARPSWFVARPTAPPPSPVARTEAEDRKQILDIFL